MSFIILFSPSAPPWCGVRGQLDGSVAASHN